MQSLPTGKGVLIQKPDFFVVGAAKAGTTSLYHYLDAHPDIYLSPIKEPNFFASDIRKDRIRPDLKRALDSNLERFLATDGRIQLHIALIQDIDLYLSLFEPAGKVRAIGECSVSYLPSRTAARNIHGFNPDARIIIMLRHPVYRALSQYRMDRKIGSIDVDFATAIEQDMKHDGPAWGEQRNYVWNGMYAKQVKRYLDLFPEEQVLVLLHREFEQDSLETMKRVFNFLDVAEDIPIDTAKRFNRAEQPRLRRLNQFLQNRGWKPMIKRLMPEGLFRTLKQMYYRESPIEDVPADIFHHLEIIFEPDIRELEGLLGRSLDIWREPRPIG